jgi:hypothetical protein
LHPRAVAPLAGLVGWLLLVGAGLQQLLLYETTPGGAGVPLPTLPTRSAAPRDRQLWTLVILAHPRCPCTRASLEELAILLARSPRRVAVQIHFYRPQEAAAGWERTDLWRTAAAIPGVQVRCDVAGKQARRFGALTSGHSLLYDGEGRLRFSGGITGGRGHAGDNPGRESVLALLDGRWDARHAVATRPVFGCPLVAPSVR